jgi:hypothetical protein
MNRGSTDLRFGPPSKPWSLASACRDTRRAQDIDRQNYAYDRGIGNPEMVNWQWPY